MHDPDEFTSHSMTNLQSTCNSCVPSNCLHSHNMSQNSNLNINKNCLSCHAITVSNPQLHDTNRYL
ncbi:hypothetical protein BpHYR1_013801 [Brachionus plicatilis]|uniref:Uncharacterized protein n=1 Tax=Brachionus plicatilis TaxID=10195 RepID=A0A3M7SWN8_BRAPC|nr:hypothetical protein BpHYR1_013801 [Brachionus plicatilis]